MTDLFNLFFGEIKGAASDSGVDSAGAVATVSVFSFIIIVAVLIMIQSALAGWWSRCYKFPLGYGFLIVLGTPIITLLISQLKNNKLKNTLFITTGIIKLIAIFYALYLQFSGRCNLGVYK